MSETDSPGIIDYRNPCDDLTWTHPAFVYSSFGTECTLDLGSFETSYGAGFLTGERITEKENWTHPQPASVSPSRRAQVLLHFLKCAC